MNYSLNRTYTELIVAVKWHRNTKLKVYVLNKLLIFQAFITQRYIMLFVLLCNCSPCLYIEMMRKLSTGKSNNQGKDSMIYQVGSWRLCLSVSYLCDLLLCNVHAMHNITCEEVIQ